MTRERVTLWLILVSVLGTIGVSTSMLGSRSPDIRQEATIALVLAVILAGAAVWMLARLNRPHGSKPPTPP